MNQQDYLLREIQKISQVLLALIDKVTGIGNVDFEIEIQQIDNILIEQFEFNISELIKIENQDLLLKLGKFNNDHLETFVELIIKIITKNNLIQNNKNISSKALMSKGLFLINHLNSISKDYSIHRASLYKQLSNLEE